MSIDFKAVGKMTADIRKACGYTQKQVYEQTKVSIETQRRIEHGLKEPKISTLERLSGLYKVDLLKLSLEKRSRESFFSDEMIRFINRMVWQRDTDAVKKEVMSYMEELAVCQKHLEPSQQMEGEMIGHLMALLEVLKDTATTGMRNKPEHIIRLEKVLMALDSSGKAILKDPYVFNIEVTLGLFLATAYSFSDRTEESMDILERLDRAVSEAEIRDLRHNDYRVAIGMNKVIVHQIREEFQVMYDLANGLLREKSVYFSPILMNDLLMLKGIAMFKLGMEGYEMILNTVLMLEEGARKDVCLSEIAYYGIPITPPN